MPTPPYGTVIKSPSIKDQEVVYRNYLIVDDLGDPVNALRLSSSTDTRDVAGQGVFRDAIISVKPGT